MLTLSPTPLIESVIEVCEITLTLSKVSPSGHGSLSNDHGRLHPHNLPALCIEIPSKRLGASDFDCWG